MPLPKKVRDELEKRIARISELEATKAPLEKDLSGERDALKALLQQHKDGLEQTGERSHTFDCPAGKAVLIAVEDTFAFDEAAIKSVLGPAAWMRLSKLTRFPDSSKIELALANGEITEEQYAAIRKVARKGSVSLRIS